MVGVVLVTEQEDAVVYVLWDPIFSSPRLAASAAGVAHDHTAVFIQVHE